MIDTRDYSSLPGKHVKGTGGDKIGKVADVYASTDDSSPTFVTVSTGLFGSKASFVPLAEAELDGDDVVVPYSKDQVTNAPHVDADEELTAEEEDRLYAHYDLAGAGAETPTETTAAPRAAAARASDDDSMIRSEEQLSVGVRTREAGRARLVKHVVTEQERVTVPVSHEEVRVVREPVEADAPVGAELSEDVIEVTLTEEVPVVTTETVPVERVRLETQSVQSQQTVSGKVRREVIETEGVDD